MFDDRLRDRESEFPTPQTVALPFLSPSGATTSVVGKGTSQEGLTGGELFKSSSSSSSSFLPIEFLLVWLR